MWYLTAHTVHTLLYAKVRSTSTLTQKSTRNKAPKQVFKLRMQIVIIKYGLECNIVDTGQGFWENLQPPFLRWTQHRPPDSGRRFLRYFGNYQSVYTA
jgi:hypothetical protein